jgi:hypothetical protein
MALLDPFPTFAVAKMVECPFLEVFKHVCHPNIYASDIVLFGLAGVKLRMSMAFHPQTDGQSEVVNKVIAMYLHCVTGDRPRSWVDWLSWAEYCYNTSFHTALRATPFEVVYGRPPPPILPYTVGSAKTEAADALLHSCDEMLAKVRQRLLEAQQLSKKYYDASHRDMELDVGAWVWLRLLHLTA